MTRRKKKHEDDFYLKEETRHWIFAILSFVIALFFILASIGNGGIVGKALYQFIALLFGWGYYLFPVVLFILSIIFIKAIRPSLIVTTIGGSFLLFFSSLGLLSIIYGKGGIIGSLLSSLLIKIFDLPATVTILAALLLISLLLTFDTTPPVQGLLEWWKKRKEDRLLQKELAQENADDGEQDDYEDGVEEEEENDMEEHDEDSEEEEDEEEVVPKKKTLTKILSFTHNKTSKTLKNKTTSIEVHLGGKPYTPPPLSLLNRDSGKPEVGDIKANTNIIKRTLQNFGIDVEMDEVSIGPSVTRYAFKPAQGVKLSRIIGLQNDLSLALAAHPLRIEAPIPGKSLVGIEVPNSSRTTVGLASLLSEPDFYDPSKPLSISMGRSVTGKPYFGSLTKMPHLLIAGATGSGKSVSIHAIIASLLYRSSPENLRFIMIDPKRVELTLYNKIHHLLTPVITNPKKAILALKWAAKEMDRRYDILEAESVRDISSYHKTIVEPAYTALKKAEKNKKDTEEVSDISLPERMPYIVIIIDELADIMGAYPREFESAIIRLAQMSRAVGIHLILSTQRPSVDVITGLIKANVPARVAFQVASQTDSRTIIDMGGAEKLLGAGDMLYFSGEMSKPVRLQSAFVSESEIKKIVAYIIKECGDGDFMLDVTTTPQDENSLFEALTHENKPGGDELEDDLYEDAREVVLSTGKASTTFIQRKLRVGYARAARLMDMLEEQGVVGPADGAKPREVYGKDDGGYGEEVPPEAEAEDEDAKREER